LENRQRRAENITRRRYVSYVKKLVISTEIAQEISRNPSPSTRQSLSLLTKSEGSDIDFECDTDEGAFGVFAQSCDAGGWIIDSGASSHMTPVKEILVDYEEFEKPQMVCLGDGQTVEAFGRGNVHLTMVLAVSSSKQVIMYDALYVPNLKCKLKQLLLKAMLLSLEKQGVRFMRRMGHYLEWKQLLTSFII